MTLREAAQMALDALVTCCAEEWRTLNNFGMKQVYDEKKVNAAITALRAALAEPEAVMHQYKYQAYGYYKEDGKLKLGTIPEPQTTHWEGCEEVHPECSKPEPVVWVWPSELEKIKQPGEGGRAMIRAFCSPELPGLKGLSGLLPLYTAPTPRKPLTNEEILDMSDATDSGDYWHLRFARAVIAAYEAKNGITGEQK